MKRLALAIVVLIAGVLLINGAVAVADAARAVKEATR
jgi:hypothetical protein